MAADSALSGIELLRDLRGDAENALRRKLADDLVRAAQAQAKLEGALDHVGGQVSTDAKALAEDYSTRRGLLAMIALPGAVLTTLAELDAMPDSYPMSIPGSLTGLPDGSHWDVPEAIAGGFGAATVGLAAT